MLLRVALVTVVALSTGAGASAHRSAPTPDHPCGVSAQPLAHYSHVMWIWFENESFDSIVGNGQAPYLNTLAKRCGLARNYRSISHPSLPNYIAATSGSTWNINDDGPPKDHALKVPSIYSQLDRAGLTWRDYEENAPGGCPLKDAGLYAVRHDPAPYFTRIRAACARWDVTLGALASDLVRDSLPSFAFVTPNLCHGMHDCPVGTGDDWLRRWLSRILDSAAYRAGKTAIFITWDEGSGSSHVALLAIAPSVPAGARGGGRFNHYSLLKTTEQLLGLSLLGHAADRSTGSMTSAFRPSP
jgi:phosphatidylinositol-3-phosphatase